MQLQAGGEVLNISRIEVALLGQQHFLAAGLLNPQSWECILVWQYDYY